MNSIRHRLLVTLVAGFAVVWVAITSMFFVLVRHHLEGVLDARLTQSAILIDSLINNHELSPSRTSGPHADSDVSGSSPYRLKDVYGNAPQTSPDADDGTLGTEIWNARGQLIALSSKGPVIPSSGVPDGFSYIRVNGTPWRVFSLTNYRRGLRILVDEPVSVRDSVITSLMIALGLPLFLFIPIISLSAWVAVTRGLSPLNAIGQRLSLVRPGSGYRLDTASIPEEVLPLVESLNSLLERIERTVDRERRFTGDASHELRTPLAALKTQLQVALASDDPKRIRRSLSGMERAADRVIHTLDQLLHLARAEQSQADESRTERPAEAVSEAIRDIGSQLGERDVKIVVAGTAPAAAIHPVSLHIAVKNLLRNAIRYSPQGGRIDVSLGSAPGRALVVVRDRGPGAAQDELRELTHRFYRGRAPKGHGSGLGLSIVSAVMAQCGGELSLSNHPEGGLVATMFIPASPRPPQQPDPKASRA